MTTDTDPRVAAEIAAFQKHYGPSEYANDPLNPRREAFGEGFREGMAAKVPSAPVEAVPRFLQQALQDRPHREVGVSRGIKLSTGKTENEIDRLETEVARLNAELQEVRKDAPAGWKLVPVEPTREMMEAMPRMPPLRAEGLPFRAEGWSLNAITNRERWAAALASAPTAQPQPPKGWKLLKDSTYEERRWDEDITPGGASYMNACVECGRSFQGGKGRRVCKVCVASPTPTLLNGLTEQETAASASLAGISGARLRHDHDWRPRELQEKHGEVTLPLAEFKRLVAAQPERLPYCSAIDPTLLAIHARTVERAERLGLDDAQSEAPAGPSDEWIDSTVEQAIGSGSHSAHFMRLMRIAVRACFAATPAPAAQQPAAPDIATAAQNLLNAVDARQDNCTPPLKYTIPYGAVNELRAALQATGGGKP